MLEKKSPKELEIASLYEEACTQENTARNTNDVDEYCEAKTISLICRDRIALLLNEAGSITNRLSK